MNVVCTVLGDCGQIHSVEEWQRCDVCEWYLKHPKPLIPWWQMSYYDLPPLNSDQELGRKIYMEALSDRRGFRDDQLGIEDEAIWIEIFEAIGQVARKALNNEQT